MFSGGRGRGRVGSDFSPSFKVELSYWPAELSQLSQDTVSLCDEPHVSNASPEELSPLSPLQAGASEAFDTLVLNLW